MTQIDSKGDGGRSFTWYYTDQAISVLYSSLIQTEADSSNHSTPKWD